MSPDQERRLEEIFRAARGLPPRERTAFLERPCRGDAELRRQALARMEHPNIASVFEERKDSRCIWIVSRNYIEGLLKADSGATFVPAVDLRQRVQLV